MEGLRSEWMLKKEQLQGTSIPSIYFGGGTPSLLSLHFFEEIFSWFQDLLLTEHCEITIEANPEELSLSLLKKLKALGANRLSIGVQSLDDSSLEILGRAHSAEKAKRALFDAQKAGFENVSIDLMLDLPHQTKASWQRTLNALPSLPITHLSLYNLTIEPNTAFHKKKEVLQKSIPKDDDSLELLEMALASLDMMGLCRYEISAFAKRGYQSKHNLGYWTYRPFLGFGPSAFSYWNATRFSNVKHLLRYRDRLKNQKSAIDFEETLPYLDHLHERLVIGLRLVEGVFVDHLPDQTKKTLFNLQEQGFVIYDGSHWKLTKTGFLFYDTVATELI